jgi:phospho-N-acetylmuramoyl-pentapeptide-transferase
MLYNLIYPLSAKYSFLNLFKYLTFRTGGAVLTSLFITFYIGPKVISWLKSKQSKGQPIRECGPKTHLLTKKGTPTMGGLMILFSTFLSTLLWADLTNPYIWVVLFVTLSYGILGFVDDYIKVTSHKSEAVSAKVKLFFQISIALIAVLWINQIVPQDTKNLLTIPFFKNLNFDLGLLYIPFAIIVIVGASNAVNITDGLDGLAIVPVILATSVFLLISYLCGHIVFADYLFLIPIPKAGELAILSGTIIGAGLGFLWFNAPPAKVFMGDTGSLALGGALGSLAIIVKHEIVLAIVGGLFVLEALSVIIQVFSYKFFGKRVFRMAPIHHHFEKKGWSEPTVVIRFWIIAVILCIIGLASLKIR